MLGLACERSGEYNTPKKKLNRENSKSRKCGCIFRMRSYLKKGKKLTVVEYS